MKIKLLYLFVMAFALSVFSERLKFTLEGTSDEDVLPFCKVVIGAIDGSKPSGPWVDGNGQATGSLLPSEGDIYMSYSGLDNYHLLEVTSYKFNGQPFYYDAKGFMTDVSFDPTGLDNAFFVAEFYDENDSLCAYTGTYSYEEVMRGWQDNPKAQWDWSWKVTTHSVPEPTSGLLLLMGGALLALRRKRQRV